jgi:hypothetical protein
MTLLSIPKCFQLKLTEITLPTFSYNCELFDRFLVSFYRGLFSLQAAPMDMSPVIALPQPKLNLATSAVKKVTLCVCVSCFPWRLTDLMFL